MKILNNTRSLFAGRVFSLLVLGSLVLHTLDARITKEAQEIVDRYVEATGGFESKKAIQYMTVTGLYELPEQAIKAPLKLFVKSGQKLAMEMEFPNVGTMRSGYNGAIGWEDNPITGFRIIEGTELEQLAKQTMIFPELALHDNYESAELLTSKNDMVRLFLVSVNGTSETWSFDPQTHLLTEISMVIDAGVQGSFPVTTSFHDYTEIEGVLIPTRTIIRNPAFQVVTSLESVDYRTKIPDSVFERPEISSF